VLNSLDFSRTYDDLSGRVHATGDAVGRTLTDQRVTARQSGMHSFSSRGATPLLAWQRTPLPVILAHYYLGLNRALSSVSAFLQA